MTDSNIPFHLLKINRGESELDFTVEVNPEFEDWFVKSHGLSEWDEAKFQTWFKTFLSDAVKDRVSMEASGNRPMSEQQKVDVYSREGLVDGRD